MKIAELIKQTFDTEAKITLGPGGDVAGRLPEKRKPHFYGEQKVEKIRRNITLYA